MHYGGQDLRVREHPLELLRLQFPGQRARMQRLRQVSVAEDSQGTVLVLLRVIPEYLPLLVVVQAVWRGRRRSPS